MATRHTVGEGHPVVELSVPTHTAGGERVTIDREPVGPGQRLHAQAPDGSVYFELVTDPGGIDVSDVAVAVAAERDWLQANATDQTIGPVEAMVVAGRPATGFDFDGTIGGARRVRHFRFVATDPGSVRIVLDPTSATDRSILASLVIRDGPA
jgi:hypothetical protein